MTPRAEALIRAAFRPRIFREMRAAKLFACSEDERQRWLRRQGFSPNGAARCSQTFMSTVEYVKRELWIEALREAQPTIEPASASTDRSE